MTPPTSIDGTDISGATIDGQEVQEITVDGNIAFTAFEGAVVGAGAGPVIAVRRTDGSELWRFNTNGETEGFIGKGDGAVYIGTDQEEIYAINKTDGSLRWQRNTSNRVRNIASDGNRVYVAFNQSGVSAFNTSNGSFIWSNGTNNSQASSGLGLDNDSVYFGTQEGRMFALDKSNGGSADHGVAQDNNTIYAALDAGRDGQERVQAYRKSDLRDIWKFKALTTNEFRGSFFGVQHDGTDVFASSDEGRAYRLNDSDGSIVWASDKEGGYEADCRVDDDAVYVVDKTATFRAYDKSDGSLIWEKTSPTEARHFFIELVT